MIIRKKIVAIACFFGFICSPAFSQRNAPRDLDGRQIAQLGCSLAKTAAYFLADRVDMSNVSQAKQAALLKMVASIAHSAGKTASYMRGFRDNVSLGSHVTASGCQIAKGIEEFVTLHKLSQEHGDTLPSSVLQTYYPGFEKEEPFNEFGFEQEESSNVKKSARFLLLITECVLSGLLACGDITPQQRMFTIMGQGVCDLLLRYACNDREFASPSFLGKVEMVASALPSCYDIGKSIYELSTQLGEKDPDWTDTCPGCGKTYAMVGGKACRMRRCRHLCCHDCAHKEAKEIVVDREIIYIGPDDKQWQEEAIKDIDLFQLSKLKRKVIVSKKTLCTCPVCNSRNQTVMPLQIMDPVAKKDVVGVKEELKFDDCCICLEKKLGIHTLSCGCPNKFCPECIRNWYNTKEENGDPVENHNKCPVCTKPFTL